MYSKKSNPKITILEIFVYKIQPEIIKSKIFTHFNFITKQISGIILFGINSGAFPIITLIKMELSLFPLNLRWMKTSQNKKVS